jgi:hypothetical protein
VIGQSMMTTPSVLSGGSTSELSATRKFRRGSRKSGRCRAELLHRWRSGTGIDDNIADLGRYFRVSRYVVARQASEANRISYEQYVDYLDRNPWFLKAAATEGEEKSGNFYNTFGARNSKKLISGEESGTG